MTLSRLSENLAMGAALTLVYVVAGKLGLIVIHCSKHDPTRTRHR